MSIEISREKWTQFFKDVSKKRFAWETKIKVSSDQTGHSVLSNGLYLNGITFEHRSDDSGEIEISVSKNKTQHQTHSIINPVKVLYSSEDKYHDSAIEIIENDGTKTTLRIFNPMPVMVGYAAHHSVSC
jgi:hypothetical protein